MPITINGNGSITGITEGLNKPAFRVSLNTDTNISDVTHTTVPFNVVDIDTDNCFDTSNYTVTPNVAGFYVVFANVTLTTQNFSVYNVTNLEDTRLFVFKNTTSIARAQHEPNNNEQAVITHQTGTIVEMNGTSDFFEVKVYIERQATNPTNYPRIAGGTHKSFFYGYKLNI